MHIGLRIVRERAFIVQKVLEARVWWRWAYTPQAAADKGPLGGTLQTLVCDAKIGWCHMMNNALYYRFEIYLFGCALRPRETGNSSRRLLACAL